MSLGVVLGSLQDRDSQLPEQFTIYCWLVFVQDHLANMLTDLTKFQVKSDNSNAV